MIQFLILIGCIVMLWMYFAHTSPNRIFDKKKIKIVPLDSDLKS